MVSSLSFEHYWPSQKVIGETRKSAGRKDTICKRAMLVIVSCGVRKSCGLSQGRKCDGTEAGSTNLSPDKYGDAERDQILSGTCCIFLIK